MDQEQKTQLKKRRAMTTRIAKSLYARHLKGEKVGTFRKWSDLDKLIEEDNKNLPVK